MTQENNISSEKITIVRKAKKSKYSIISNSVMQDLNLSWKAKGIICYLLHLPDDWRINIRELTKHSTDGRDSLTSGLKELENKGYIVHENLREKGKFAGHIWIVHEEPVFTEKLSDNEYEPESDFPDPANSDPAKPTLLNTKDSESKDSSSIQNTNSILAPSGALSASADEIFSFFIQKLKEFKPDIKIPENPDKWKIEIDRMIRIDKRDPKKIREMIEWIYKDSFWASNILSPKKLRDQFDNIDAKAKFKSEKNISEKNKDYANRQKVKYPETYKNLRLTEKYAINSSNGKEIPLTLPFQNFGREFTKIFGINWNDLSESDKK